MVNENIINIGGRKIEHKFLKSIRFLVKEEIIYVT